MALENVAPVINMKNHSFDGEGLLEYGIGDTLTTKLASLTLHSTVMLKSTPPALLTPSPPPQTAAAKEHQYPAESEAGFHLRIIGVEDSEKVIGFLSRNFFLDEPLNIALDLLNGGNGQCAELEDFSLSDIHQGLSVMAVDDDGEILGLLLGAAVYKKEIFNYLNRDEVGIFTVGEPGNQGTYRAYDLSSAGSRDHFMRLRNVHQLCQCEEDEDWSIGCNHPKFKKILKFLYNAEKECNIFSHYPDLNSFYDIKILSVDTSCRGRGVGSMLTKKAFSLAREAGLGFLKIDCSSHFSSKIAERLGCTINYCIKYTDYKVDGEVVFNTEPPHTQFCIKSTRL